MAIVLIGMPAAGKTRIGQQLATVLGTDFVDTDDLVEADIAMTIADYFASHGEQAFRRREADAVTRALTHGGVVSLGGGAVETPQVRHALADQVVVYLHVDRKQCIANLTDDDERPLMQHVNVADRVDELMTRRVPLYEALATITVTVNKRDAVGHATAIANLLRPHPISVTGQSHYDVVFGYDMTDVIARHIDSGARVLIMHPPALHDYAHVVGQALTHASHVGYEVTADGEEQKTAASATAAWNACAQHHLGRDDVIVGIGGGATTDFAGFIAATWLRGIEFVSVPTSVLAMVDAGIGGKTGINTPAGKNLVGAFYPPSAVVSDLATLATLPHRMLVEGLGEVIKCGFIDSDRIIDIVRDNDRDVLWDKTRQPFQQILIDAATVKARVVSQDLKESGLRENLNYGHTFAHALENAFGYTVPHGQAVAVGMVFAARVANRLGMLTNDEVALHEQLLTKLGLHTRYRGATWPQLLSAMQQDKKVRRGQLRFVLLDGIGNPTRMIIDDIDMLADVAAELQAQPGSCALEYGKSDIND